MMPTKWLRQRRPAVFVVSAVAALTLGAGLAFGASIRLYVVQYLLSGTNGVNGYIRGNAASFHDPVNDATADWVSLFFGDGSGAGSWVQIGQFQGTLGGPGYTAYSPTAMHLYGENMTCQGVDYFLIDLGAPAQPNYAVYMYWDGGSSSVPCGTASRYAFKTGSLANAPRMYGYLQSTWGYPEAALENRYVSTGSPEPIGTVRFGENNVFVADSGYGLHLYTKATNTWALWKSATFAGTTSSPSGYAVPYTYALKQPYWAFEAQP